MKRAILAIGLILSFQYVHAKEDQNYIPTSSFTDVTTAGPIIYSSVSYQFVGVMVSSPAGGYVAIFRSTSSTFLSEIATQTYVNTFATNGQPFFVPMFDMKNDSFTYISKVGNAAITIYGRCLGGNTLTSGGAVDLGKRCPGLKSDGSR